MQKDIQKTLTDRNRDYGDYKGGNEFRARVMCQIKDRYYEVHGTYMPSPIEMVFFDIINKLSRLAVTPDHVDSWKDMAGYSMLIMDMYSDEEVSSCR